MKNPGRIFLGVLLLYVLSASVSAQANYTSSKNITIRVTVSEKTYVDINPDELNWTGGDAVEPCASGVEKAVQIENVGSTNISYVWFNNSYPSDSPFGTGDPSEYDAGNFMVIRDNASAGEASYFYANRVEYNETQLIYLTFDAAYANNHGRLRRAEGEYFWGIDPDGTECNSTSANFVIGVVPHNRTQMGTVDLQQASCTAGLTASAAACRYGAFEGTDGTWAWADVVVGDLSGTYWNYSVAVNASCDVVQFVKWAMDAPGSTAAGNDFASYFVYDGSTVLNPGANRIANVKAKVPCGTAAGNVGNGRLTVIAMAVDVGG